MKEWSHEGGGFVESKGAMTGGFCERGAVKELPPLVI